MRCFYHNKGFRRGLLRGGLLLLSLLTAGGAGPVLAERTVPLIPRTPTAAAGALAPAAVPHRRTPLSRAADKSRAPAFREVDRSGQAALKALPLMPLPAERLAAAGDLTDPRSLRRPRLPLLSGTAAAAAAPTATAVPRSDGATRFAPDKSLPWTADQLLANPTNMNDEYVSIAENPLTGHLFAVFAAMDLGGSDRDIHIAKSSDGGVSWSERELPSFAIDESMPDLAVDGAGYLHVVWVRADGVLMRARSAAPDDPTSWTNLIEFIVEEPLAVPSIAVSGAGDFAKVFIAVNWNTVNWDYYWTEWTLLFFYSTNGGLTVSYDYFLPDGYEDLWPDVAMDGGVVHFLNAEVDGYSGETEILIATDAYNGGFGDPGSLSGWTANNCGFPRLTADGGDVFIVYQHDYTDGLTTDGDIIYHYSWDGGSSFYGPYGMIADPYESLGPAVFTRDGLVGCLWLDAPAGADEFQLASRLGSGRGHIDYFGDVEQVSEAPRVEPAFHSAGGAAAAAGLHAAWIDRRDYATQGHNVYTSRRALTPNLAGFVPTGWDAPLVAAGQRGGRSTQWLAAGDTTFVSFAFLNDGLSGFSGDFQVRLDLDGAPVATWGLSGSLPAGSYAAVEDHPLVVGAGSHTLRVVLDPAAQVAESDEADNELLLTAAWIDGDPALRLNPTELHATILPPAARSTLLTLADDPPLRREAHLPVLAPELARRLETADKSARLRVMIVPAERVDPAALDRALAGAAPQTRREIALAAARTQSTRSLARLAPALDRLQAAGLAGVPRPLWLGGSVAVDLAPAAVDELAHHPDVGWLWLDDQRSTTFGLPAAAGAADKASAWHLAAIGAEQAWAQGWNGQGVLVGHLDTGVAYDHPDLANHLWDGGAAYPRHGYDLVDEDNDPYDGDAPYYHGTHTAGLIVGDGSSGTATGAAPGATLLALRAVPGYVEDLAQALQFGLEHGVDLFSLSGGWQQASDATRAANRYQAELLLAAGVPWFVAAGNGDNAGGHYAVPLDITSPGDCPSPWYAPNGGRTAVFTVGATTSGAAVSSLSSLGPTAWDLDNPYGTTSYHDYPYPGGLMKPDIAAPGETITSCFGEGGYVVYDGTSMATPLVAGAAAILLSAPGTPAIDELCRTLEASATDLAAAPAAPGRDAASGAGLLNIPAALAALPSAETIDFWVCNDGVLPLVVDSILDNAQWVSCDPTALTVDPGDSARVRVQLDPSALFEGVHHASLYVLSNDPARYAELPVTLIYGEGISAADPPPAAVRRQHLTNHPNPFNPRTVLRCATPTAGRVRLEIFDVRGRRLRLLLDEVLPAGDHELVWDGRDDRGRDLPSGQYLARLSAPRLGPATRKLTLLR